MPASTNAVRFGERINDDPDVLAIAIGLRSLECHEPGGAESVSFLKRHRKPPVRDHSRRKYRYKSLSEMLRA